MAEFALDQLRGVRTNRRGNVGRIHSGVYMGTRFHLHLLVTLMSLSSVALAEGNCPAGFYPIGGQGVQGCAPIPGRAVPQAQGQPRATPGVWEDRWGAIADDSADRLGATLVTGVVRSRGSEAEAKRMALAECVRLGGKECAVRMTYYNQCVAIADPMNVKGGSPVGQAVIARAPSEAKARANAVSSCSRLRNGQVCEIAYSACSFAEFRAY